jgi:DNA-binding MarR family transcriptional regulator
MKPYKAMMSFGALVHAGTLLGHKMNEWCQSELGVSLPEYDLLKQVDLHDGQLRMVDLAERLMMTKMGITKMVDRLEEAGLARRESSAEDRRVVIAALTEEGAALLKRSHPLFRDWVGEHFAELLSDDEIEDVGRVSRKLLEELGRRDVHMEEIRIQKARGHKPGEQGCEE